MSLNFEPNFISFFAFVLCGGAGSSMTRMWPSRLWATPSSCQTTTGALALPLGGLGGLFCAAAALCGLLTDDFLATPADAPLLCIVSFMLAGSGAAPTGSGTEQG